MTSIKLNKVFAVMLVMLFIFASSAWSATYRYNARTSTTVKQSGIVKAGGISWNCRAKSTICTTSGPWPVPSYQSCAALAKKVGKITYYGHSKKRLSSAQLVKCNSSIVSSKSQIYRYTARTKSKVRRSGIIKIGTVSWNCRANSNICTASGPWPNPSYRACNALAKQVGQITYYGHSKKHLTTTQLENCNSNISTARTATTLRPKLVSRTPYKILIKPKSILLKAPTSTRTPADTKPSKTKEEQKEPTGPDVTKPVDLISALVDVPEVESDFQSAIGWFYQIFPDLTAKNIFYYMPSEYRISRDANPKVGYNLKFTYGYSDEASTDALVSLNVKLEPPHRQGDLSLLKELAKRSLKTKEEIELKPFPMLSAKIDFAELQQAFGIKPDNISITAPKHVREPVPLTIRMNETDKEEFITHLRNIGLAGRIIIEGENADLEIPIKLGFNEYTGQVVSEVSEVGPGKPVRNMSPFPVSLTGFVSYSINKNNQLLRNTYPFKRKVRILPGSRKSVPDLMKTIKGKPILAWFEYEQDLSCKSCFDAIEKQVLAVAGLTSKDILNVEAIPMLFSSFNIYKIIVEIKSPYFDPGSDHEQIKNINLKEGAPSQEIAIYIDRDKSDEARKFSFRFKPVMNDGSGPDSFSRWVESDTLDITITPAHINEVTGQ